MNGKGWDFRSQWVRLGAVVGRTEPENPGLPTRTNA